MRFAKAKFNNGRIGRNKCANKSNMVIVVPLFYPSFDLSFQIRETLYTIKLSLKKVWRRREKTKTMHDTMVTVVSAGVTWQQTTKGHTNQIRQLYLLQHVLNHLKNVEDSV